MRTLQLLSAARRLGREAGRAAASWTYDGNTSRETAARIVRMIEDGDPALYDEIREPNLSGEFADGPTPRSLAEDCGLDDEDPRAEWLEDSLCEAWESGVSATFWPAVERAYRAILA